MHDEMVQPSGPGPAALDLAAPPATMSGLVAAFDWSATSIGPQAAWPDSLKATVRILLTSRFPMWMAWGPRS